MTQADRIREFVNRTYIEPAREVGTQLVLVRAGDVHEAMRLTSRMPAVASALGATTFEMGYGVRCKARTGPHNGANLVFTFEVLVD